MSTHISADEVWFGGYLVAVLAQSGVPATVLGAFEDHINAGTLFDADKHQCSECNAEAYIPHLHDCKQYKPLEKDGKGGETRDKVHEQAYDACIADVRDSIKRLSKNGLLRVSDLERMLHELETEGHLE